MKSNRALHIGAIIACVRVRVGQRKISIPLPCADWEAALAIMYLVYEE
ncbi:MAG TPA: hypothetical protein PKN99_03120 [Cyclobacteriaceae bacterium]|nr:hypothetical protein [Cyclobacteriaceae bacterium]